MNYLTIGLLALAVIVLLALALYLVGFRWTKLKLKWGFGEAELERTPPEESKDPSSTSSPTTTIDQQASEGAVIRKSPIKAPASSGAQITQKARDDESRIDESGITLE